MQQRDSPSSSSHSAPGTARPGSTMHSLWTVKQRLTRTERELRVQFTRIAQIQAQLDLVVGAIRSSPAGIRV